MLKENGVDPQTISCIQRQLCGEIVITFRTEALKEAFIQRNVLALRGQPFAIQDIDCPLTYLQIFDAPYELPDSAIVERLSHYCEVVHQFRGYFTEPGFQHIHDGVRHFRVRVKHPIPSFLRFGKIQIHLRYISQQKTCHRCNSPDHLANACNAVVCFNCDDIGHLANNCPHPVFCNLCKSADHKAKNCPHSWAREITREDPASEMELDAPLTNQQDHMETQTDVVELTCDEELPESDESSQPLSLETNLESSQSSEQDSPQLFTQSQDPSPLGTQPANRRQPAKVIEVNIPTRKPTTPVLVTGKSTTSNSESSQRELSQDSEHSELPAHQLNQHVRTLHPRPAWRLMLPRHPLRRRQPMLRLPSSYSLKPRLHSLHSQLANEDRLHRLKILLRRKRPWMRLGRLGIFSSSRKTKLLLVTSFTP